MSAINLDEPGFNALAGSTAPPSSDSSVEHPSDGRCKCVACPRRMSAKTADRHTICVLCRGFDCSVEARCKECIDWPDQTIRLYAKMRKSLKSKSSLKHRNKPSASPPSADSVPSSQPSAIAQMQSQVDYLNLLVNSLSESLFARLDALTASIAPASVPQSSSQPSQGPDAELPQPGVTTGESRMFQALGATSRTSDTNARLRKGVRTPRQEYVDPSAAPQPHAAPEPAPQPSATFVPPQPPPRSGVPPSQPSTSGWVPSGPPPHSRGSRSSSESEASETESEVAARDNTSARLADLIYEACPHSRLLLDDSRRPRCDFEGWFGQPEYSASRPGFRLYPRVGEVE